MRPAAAACTKAVHCCRGSEERPFLYRLWAVLQVFSGCMKVCGLEQR